MGNWIKQVYTGATVGNALSEKRPWWLIVLLLGSPSVLVGRTLKARFSLSGPHRWMTQFFANCLMSVICATSSYLWRFFFFLFALIMQAQKKSQKYGPAIRIFDRYEYVCAWLACENDTSTFSRISICLFFWHFRLSMTAVLIKGHSRRVSHLFNCWRHLNAICSCFAADLIE